MLGTASLRTLGTVSIVSGASEHLATRAVSMIASQMFRFQIATELGSTTSDAWKGSKVVSRGSAGLVVCEFSQNVQEPPRLAILELSKQVPPQGATLPIATPKCATRLLLRTSAQRSPRCMS